LIHFYKRKFHPVGVFLAYELRGELIVKSLSVQHVGFKSNSVAGWPGTSSLPC